VYADALESLIGFIYIEKELEFTKHLILQLWKEELDTLPQKDPKTFIQEYSQKINKVIPTYNVVEESGIKHKPKFKISLKINDLYVEGEGVSKQKAEIVAAKKMIKLIQSK
jgi:ribonuclease-3